MGEKAEESPQNRSAAGDEPLKILSVSLPKKEEEPLTLQTRQHTSNWAIRKPKCERRKGKKRPVARGNATPGLAPTAQNPKPGGTTNCGQGKKEQESVLDNRISNMYHKQLQVNLLTTEIYKDGVHPGAIPPPPSSPLCKWGKPLGTKFSHLSQRLLSAGRWWVINENPLIPFYLTECGSNNTMKKKTNFKYTNTPPGGWISI